MLMKNAVFIIKFMIYSKTKRITIKGKANINPSRYQLTTQLVPNYCLKSAPFAACFLP
jgi:hypothetical protein